MPTVDIKQEFWKVLFQMQGGAWRPFWQIEPILVSCARFPLVRAYLFRGPCHIVSVSDGNSFEGVASLSSVKLALPWLADNPDMGNAPWTLFRCPITPKYLVS